MWRAARFLLDTVSSPAVRTWEQTKGVRTILLDSLVFAQPHLEVSDLALQHDAALDGLCALLVQIPAPQRYHWLQNVGISCSTTIML